MYLTNLVSPEAPSAMENAEEATNVPAVRTELMLMRIMVARDEAHAGERVEGLALSPVRAVTETSRIKTSDLPSEESDHCELLDVASVALYFYRKRIGRHA